MRADFYQLSQVPLERALPAIAERVLASGETLLIVADDEALLSRLDGQLWRYKPESFLPHGREAGQPVRLATPEVDAGDARTIALVDGVWRDRALSFARAFYFFDSQSIEGARAAWRGLADKDDVERHYWKQDENGRWAEGP